MKLGPYELDTIVTGDARELSKTLPDNSIDFALADPVYAQIDDYGWLARTAARILKPDRACLAWTSKVTLPECKEAMTDGGLNYQSTLYYVVQAKQARPIFAYGIIPWTTPCLIFAKGRYKCDPFIPDTFVNSKPSQNGFMWQKNTEVLVYWLNAFTKPGDIVFDPFAGSGSVSAACKMTNRHYIAFEIIEERANLARRRVANTQPPLPGINEMVQVGMFIEQD